MKGFRNPSVHDLVEIWSEIPGTGNGLEMHLVMCTKLIRKDKVVIGIHFIHSLSGPIGYAPINKVNRIFPWTSHMEGPIREEFNAKQRKVPKHEY